MKTNTLIPLGYRGFLIAGAAVALFASLVMLAYADVAPTVTTTINNSGGTAISTAAIGSSVFASATVASTSATTSPSGTVTFNRYENNSCTGTATSQSAVALVNGMASSSLFTVPASGLSYKVHYNGQTDVYAQADSVCQSVTATASSTTLTTTLSTTSVAAGSTVNETATLAGATANAGGSVSYVVYSDNACNNSLVGAGVRTVTNALVPASDSVMFNNAGTYYWRAAYVGDANNASATSSCLALSVIATTTPPVTPTTTAMISGTVYNDLDKDMIKDVGEAGVPSFSVVLHQGNLSGAVLSTLATDGNGYYSFGSLANGTYSLELLNKSGWHQDTMDYASLVIANQVALSSKDFAVSTTNPTTTPTTTPNGTGMIGGKVFNDLDKDEVLDSGEAGLAGFTVNLYNAKGWSGKNNKAPFMTMTTDANGNYSFANLAKGTYSIELINKSGWHQDTGDYDNLKINGNTRSDLNFANSSTTSNGNGNGNGNHNGNSGWHWGGWNWGWWK